MVLGSFVGGERGASSTGVGAPEMTVAAASRESVALINCMMNNSKNW
jgi:hypothetical protein